MFECSKAMKRRASSLAFMTRYFVGRGIDVGAGSDGLSRYTRVFPGIQSVFDWDVANGDGQTLQGIEANSFDFVHSSHCLEHVEDPEGALLRWLDVIRPDGHLVCVVPSQELYEHNTWPSMYGEGHKHSFVAEVESPKLEKTIDLLDLIDTICGNDKLASLERYEVLRDFYDASAGMADQTMTPNAECGIEFVLRKRR